VKPLEKRITGILEKSINRMNTAFTIARMIEEWDGRKRGSMHLAVKLAARRMEARGEIVIVGPKDRWDSYLYALSRS
jgi:hypothetical protein